MSTITAGSSVITRTGVVGVVESVKGDAVAVAFLDGTGVPCRTTVTLADIVG